MTPSWKVLVFISVLCLRSFPGVAEAGERIKRELRFPKGASLSAGVALASFLPKGPTDGLAHVLEFDLGFPLPDRFAIDKKKPQKRIWGGTPQKPVKGWHKNKINPPKKFRGKRNLKEQEKKNLLFKIEDAITRMGFNGSSCAYRLQCELRNISPQNSLLEELLIALFQPPTQPDEEECKERSTNCPISLLHVILHSNQIPSS